MSLNLPDDPKLIIICGNPHDGDSPKYDRIFSSNVTFGYRDYARVYGALVFPFSIRGSFASYEAAVNDPAAIADYCNAHPNAIVWSLKKSTPAKSKLLRSIRNKKVYYSCGATNLVDKDCDVSLVDTKQRLKSSRARLWVKGKDPEQWRLLTANRVYDYCLIGKPRDGKNQKLFYSKIFDNVTEPRSILWVGGSDSLVDIPVGKHSLRITPYARSDELPALFAQCKVGGLFTEWRDEGFPQSYLEMAMCGLPVVYHEDAPWADVYGSTNISRRASRRNLVDVAEELLRAADHAACRADAVSRFSLEASMSSIVAALG